MNKFKIDDKVIVVADEERLSRICDDATLTGKTGIVKQYDTMYTTLPWLIDLGPRSLWFAEQDIALIESDHQFKINDKVKVIADKERLEMLFAGELLTGKTGVIIDIKDDEPTSFKIQIDGVGWWLAEQDFELVEPERTFVGHPDGGLEVKETNPKDIIGMKKAPISTLSCPVLFEMGLGMLEGARKYGRHNYRAMGVSATVYFDASVGHLMDWFEGEDIDPDSGLNHVTKAMTALLVLRDSMLMGNWVDDRPLRNPNKLYKKSFNLKAKKVIEQYPDAVEPYTEANKNCVRDKTGKIIDRTKPVPGGY